MLPDTLGILNPLDLLSYIRKMVKRYPGVHFDFHAHNDYDLAISNVPACRVGRLPGYPYPQSTAWVSGGMPPLASVQAILKDQFNAMQGIDESRFERSEPDGGKLFRYPYPAQPPDYGRECVLRRWPVIACRRDNKANLYCNDLCPELLRARKREACLGREALLVILKNLEELGLELSPEQTRKVTERIIELGDKKELVTQEDLPYIVSDVLKHDTVRSMSGC